MKRTAPWIVIVLAIGAAGGAWFDPTQVIVGKLAGDQFFASRPTRYWAHALRAGPAEQADARQTLEQGGAAAVPVLTAMLTEFLSPDDAELRWTAAEMLTKLGPDAVAAGPALVAGLQDSDPHVQAVCAAALPKAEVAADKAIEPLIRLLPTDHSVVAARALADYKGEAAPALPTLIELMQDKSRDIEVRWNAIRTIGRIGPEGVSALPVLIEALGDPDWMIREHSAEAIGDFGPAAGPEAVTALVPMLTDEHARVRRDAVRSLGYMGALAHDTAAEIKLLLNDAEEQVREAAADALRAAAPEELPAEKSPAADGAAPNVSSPR